MEIGNWAEWFAAMGSIATAVLAGMLFRSYFGVRSRAALNRHTLVWMRHYNRMVL